MSIKLYLEFFFVFQNDLMVAQSEVEKLREELGRVRAEGTGNLFGENMLSGDVNSLFVRVGDSSYIVIAMDISLN